MLTKERLKEMPDNELLELVTKAKGNTGKEFKTHFKTDFSYSVVLGELRNRGYENGWYKAGDSAVVAQKKTEYIYLEDLEASNGEVKKTSFDISKKTLERWRRMTSMISHKSKILELAMNRFMDELDSGKMDFRWKR